MLWPLCRTSKDERHKLLAMRFQKGESTHPRDPVKVTGQINPQNLDCDMAALVFTLPDIGIPTTV